MDTILKEIVMGAIAPGTQAPVKFQGIKLSESSLKKFIPILGVMIYNQSTEDIRVFMNETNDNAVRLPGNSALPLSGVPMFDITVENLDASETIAAGEVIITLFNDFEQVSRYDAWARKKGL